MTKNIEVFPEHQTGVGNLDFLLVGDIENIGRCYFCIEIKLAHSQDLEHGLVEQLPSYMRSLRSRYGTYCVLNFKGNWFDKPKIKDNHRLDFYLHLLTKESNIPEVENIRIFIFDFAKELSASK